MRFGNWLQKKEKKMNEKAFKALENVKREAGNPYFSTLYDIDMWRIDFETIENGLKIPDKMNEVLFEFYYSQLFQYSKAETTSELNFYEGSLETIVSIYSKFNNLSLEETKRILADKARDRIRKQQ